MKEAKSLAALALALALGVPAALGQTQNLVPDPGFSSLGSGAKSPVWRCSKENPQELDQSVKPAPSCHQSLKIPIAVKADAWGEVAQDLKLKGSTNYDFSCQVKGSVSKLGFLMVKIFDKDGKQVKMLLSDDNPGPVSSETKWESLRLHFTTTPSGKTTIALRHYENTDALGETVWFANPKLVEAK